MKKFLFSTTLLMITNVLSIGQTNDYYMLRTGDFIYREPNDSNMVVFVPFDAKVKLIEKGEKYYRVMYKDFTGWIKKEIVYTEADYKAEKLAEKKTIEKAKQDRVNALNKRRAALIEKYGSQEIAEKIMAKRIWLGMTDKMARDSWGAPSDINRSVGSWGVHEQWIYNKSDTYLYFENGVLTSWQD